MRESASNRGSAAGMTTDKPLISTDWDLLEFQELVLQDLLGYWNKCRGARAVPARADIDVTEVPVLLPYIFIIDVFDGPRDFRFRVAGTHIRDALGEEITGKHIGEVFPPEFGAEVYSIWSHVIDDRRPVRGTGDLWIPGREFVKWEGLAMPLSSDGDGVNMLLGGVVFHQIAHKRP